MKPFVLKKYFGGADLYKKNGVKVTAEIYLHANLGTPSAQHDIRTVAYI